MPQQAALTLHHLTFGKPMAQRPSVQYHSWSGVYGDTFTLGGLRSRCVAFKNILLEHNWSCVVSFDTRFMANQYALEALHMLHNAGVKCCYCPNATPLPALERALEQRVADCALLISAGNQAYWNLGLLAITPPIPEEPFEAANPIAEDGLAFPSQGPDPNIEQVDLRSAYIEVLRGAVDIELLRRTTLTMFVDPMHGSTSGYLPAALGEGTQLKAIEINREADAFFGKQTPHPFDSGVPRLRKLVRESDSHFGVAFSANGNALVVVDNQGNVVIPRDLAIVLGTHLSRQYRQRGVLIVPSESPINAKAAGPRWLEDHYGLRIEQAYHTSEHIADQVARDRAALVAGLTNTGEAILGRYTAVPDALLTALILTEAVARSGSKLHQLLNSLRNP